MTSVLMLRSWWGPKVLLWLVLVVVSFFIPNGFFMVWGNYIAMIGATIFILLGLVLLVDFAHSWSETCIENWESSESNLWQWILIGSAAAGYGATIALTSVLYAFFAGSGCTLNRFFISFNLVPGASIYYVMAAVIFCFNNDLVFADYDMADVSTTSRELYIIEYNIST